MLWSASVKTLLSVAASTSVRISAAVWSVVAPASIFCSLVLRASLNSLVSDTDSYNAFISEAVWSSLALVSIVSNLVPRAATSLPSTVPDTVISPVTV